VVTSKKHFTHAKKKVKLARRGGGGAVDGGSVNAFLAAALTHVMRAAVTMPAVASASASVLHSVAVGGSVVGVVRPL